MSLAATREKRSNAGNRIARLLEEGEEDEFYTTTYGGFKEEDEDNDYQSEGSVSDNVDSDFDIDEQDEVRSDTEDNNEPKRRKGVDTKAYKEPAKPKTNLSKPKPKVRREKKPQSSTVQIYQSEMGRKSLRESTSQKSILRAEREKEREKKAKMMKEIAARKNVSQVRRLTQEELLLEAKLTEEVNLQALETYHKMQLEKKKSRVTKQIHVGPRIKYQSVTMPLLEELPNMDISVDEDSSDSTESTQKNINLKSSEKCSRTFITFTDEKNFRQYFPKKKSHTLVKKTCPVTGLPAKYFDPITLTPYANAHAFKVLRQAYKVFLEKKPTPKRYQT